MILSLKLFVSLLFMVSNVFAEDLEQACMDLLEPDNMGEHCCESSLSSQSVHGDFASCFPSDDVSCENFECLMEKRGLLKDHLIDEDAVKKQIEKLIQNHPSEKVLIEQIQKGCLDRKYENYSEDNECPASDFFACLFVNANLGCPKWKASDKCNKMAENAKKCKEYVEGAR